MVVCCTWAVFGELAIDNWSGIFQNCAGFSRSAVNFVISNYPRQWTSVLIDLCTSVFVFLTSFSVNRDSMTLYHSEDSKVTITFEDWQDAIKAIHFFQERWSLELDKHRMSLETGHAQAAGFCGGYPVLALGASAGNNVEYAGPYGYPVPARGEAKPAPRMSLSELLRHLLIGVNTQGYSFLDPSRAARAAQPQTGAVAVSAQGTTSAAERKDKSKASACGRALPTPYVSHYDDDDDSDFDDEADVKWIFLFPISLYQEDKKGEDGRMVLKPAYLGLGPHCNVDTDEVESFVTIFARGHLELFADFVITHDFK